MQRLCGQADRARWNRDIGPKVEEAITDWAGIPRRLPKPYRFVALIREQVGLPEERIPQFVAVLRRLRDDPGWNSVTPAAGQQIERAVTAAFGQPTCAARFLSGPRGRGLLAWVCRRLTNYEDGHLSREALCELDVYRPDLMARVLAALDVDAKHRPQSTRGHWTPPVLLLDWDTGRIFLKFDVSGAAKRQITCDQWGGPVYQAAIPIGGRLRPSDRYTGTHKVGNGQPGEAWEIDGWKPDGADWSLFDEHGRFVCRRRQDETQVVMPRPYLLVIEENMRRRSGGLEHVTDLGPLELDASAGNYAILSIEMTTEVRVDGLCLRTGVREKLPRLMPESRQQWSRWAYANIILSAKEPIVKIEDWTAANQRRWRVFCQANGKAQHPVVTVTEPSGGRIDLSPLPVPSTGELWLEDLHSSRLDGKVAMSFTIFPDCRIAAPTRLLPDAEMPEVSIVSGGMPVTFRPADPTDLVDGPPHNGHFRVRDRLTRLEGWLCHGASDVQIAIPLHRARFRSLDTPHKQLILTPEALSEMTHSGGPGERSAMLELFSLPDSHTVLTLRAMDGTNANLDVLSRNGGPSGRSLVMPNEFVDAVTTSNVSIGQFAVRCGGTPVATDTWYADVSKLEAMLRTVPLPPTLREELPEALRWIVDRTSVDSLPIVSALPPELWRLKAKCLYLRHILEAAPVPRWVQDWVDPRDKVCLDDIRRLLTACGVGALRPHAVDPRVAVRDMLAATHLRRQWAQVFRRQRLRDLGISRQTWWRRTLRLIFRQLKQCASMHRWVAELQDAFGGSQSTAVPAPVARAGRLYSRALAFPVNEAHGYILEASHLLNATLCAADLDPSWRDCSLLLRSLCLLRLGEISYAVGNVLLHAPREQFRLAWAEIQAIRGLLLHEPVPTQPSPGESLIARISPRRDDQLLARALRGGFGEWRQAGASCWLGAWLGWRWSIVMGRPIGERDAMHDLALRLANAIPSTLDGDLIRRELDDGDLQEWQESRNQPTGDING
jgi:hypothetical protein